jgi:hypothetical protein
MFANPRWFQKKNNGLTPTCWQGWACVLVWIAVFLVPFMALMAADKTPEAFVWLLVIMLVALREIRQIQRHLAGQGGGDEEDVLYIGDDAESSHLATQNFDMHLRQ